MNKRFMTGSLAVMLLGVVVSRVPAARADQEAAVPAPTDRPSALTEIDGRAVLVDLDKQQLTVKDVNDQSVTLNVTPGTVISSAGSSKLVLKDLKKNDKIHAYYTTADNKARQIDVSGGMPIMRDLETH